MTSFGVAKHDLGVVWNTTVRNGLIVVSVTTAAGGLLTSVLLSDGQPTSEFLSFSLWLIMGTILPACSLLLSAVAISGTRESGQLRVLFGAPINRSQFFLGTLLSRSVTAIVVSVAALTVLLLFVILTTGNAPSLMILLSAGYTVVVTAVYAVIGISISAISQTRIRSIIRAIAVYIVLAFWPQLTGSVFELGSSGLGLLQLIPRLSPFGAYSQIATPSEAIYAASVESWHLSVPMMTVILLMWIFLPAAAGYLLFCQSDIL